MKREYVIFGVSSVVSLGLGAVSGFFFAKKRLEIKYTELSQREIAEAKTFYSALYKKEEYATPELTVENRNLNEAVKAIKSYQGQENDNDEPVSVVNNIFVNAQPTEDRDFDYDEEVKHRSLEVPYIITKEEFLEAEAEFPQKTLTYFTGDDVLSDEEDKPIEDTDLIVGDDNLLRFGHGSGDPHVVYIRNEKHQIEYEIVNSKGKYSEDVLGFIQHADHHKTRRFKDDDG